MEIHLRCCAGLDVHKRTVTACARRITDDGEVVVEALSFGTMTADLLAWSDWRAARRVRHVAMESTGVDRKPVFPILEGRFTMMPVNAHHIKHVPGRKTDVKDARWIAERLQHGLLSPSFVPPPPIRALRDLTRQRSPLVRDEAAVAARIQEVLEGASIQPASAASDPPGASGRDDPDTLAEEARARLRAKIPESRQALRGRVTDHHRFVLRALMGQVEHPGGRIAGYDRRIAEARAPRAATAGLCPGNDASAGRRRSGRTTEGDQALRTAPVPVAWAAVHAKGTIFPAQSGRWLERMGKKKAPAAVAPEIVVLIHRLLKTGTDHREEWVAPAAD